MRCGSGLFREGYRDSGEGTTTFVLGRDGCPTLSARLTSDLAAWFFSSGFRARINRSPVSPVADGRQLR